MTISDKSSPPLPPHEPDSDMIIHVPKINTRPLNNHQLFQNSYAYIVFLVSHFNTKQQLLIEADKCYNEWKKYNEHYIPFLIDFVSNIADQTSGKVDAVKELMNVTDVTITLKQEYKERADKLKTVIDSDTSEEENTVEPRTPITRSKPRQDALTHDIDKLTREQALLQLDIAKLDGITHPQVASILMETKEKSAHLQKTIRDKQTQLMNLQNRAAASRKSYAKSVAEKMKKNEVILISSRAACRPKEFDSTEIIKIIEETVSGQSETYTDARRRSMILKSRTRVTDIVAGVKETYSVAGKKPPSRTTILNHMIPTNKRTRASRAHHPNATVKTTKQTEDLPQKPTPDFHHCCSNNVKMKYLASKFHSATTVVSRDKKANVPLKGNATSNSFKAAVIGSEKIRVHDHDFQISGESIAPFCHLVCRADGNQWKAVQLHCMLRYNDANQTNVAVTIKDLCKILDSFIVDEEIPPVLYLYTDEGDGGAPTNRKMQIYMWYLTRKYNLDIVVLASFGPYMSRYNMVERSMCGLGKPLIGVTDLMNKFNGDRNRRINKSMKWIGDQWRNMHYGDKPLSVDYVSVNQDEGEHKSDVEGFPSFEDFAKALETPALYRNHQVMEHLQSLHKHSIAGNGAHCFQLVKCDNRECCSEKRCPQYFEYLKEWYGFLPGPVPGDSIRGQMHHKTVDQLKQQYRDAPAKTVCDVHSFDQHLPSRSERSISVCPECKRQCHSKVEFKFHCKYVDCEDFSKDFHYHSSSDDVETPDLPADSQIDLSVLSIGSDDDSDYSGAPSSPFTPSPAPKMRRIACASPSDDLIICDK